MNQSFFPEISVIVPVYKVEPYLDRCVRSIAAQTYRNLEIILVDDGSPDNCPAMCDAWAEKDPRIKVIHKKNGGLSDARNAGMEAASGELMGFIDSDDWIEADMYELLYQQMQKDKSDIAACGVEMVWEDDTPSRMLTTDRNCVLSKTEAMKAIINEDLLKQPVWYKLYRTSLIKDLPFAVGKCHEDVFWSYQAIGRSERISVINTPCYHYVQRKGSIMGTRYSLKRLDGLEAKKDRLTYIGMYFPNLSIMAESNFFFSAMYSMQMSMKFLDTNECMLAQHMILLCLKNIRYWDVIKYMPVKQKVWPLMASFSFTKCCQLRNLLNIGL